MLVRFTNSSSDPYPIRHVRRHGWRDAQGLVQPDQIVVSKVQRDGRLQVFRLLAESIGQAGKPAHGHTHRQVLTLNMAGTDMGLVGAPRDHCARHTRRAASPH